MTLERRERPGTQPAGRQEAALINAALEQESTRTQRFLDRLDAHLPTLPDDACRHRFLAGQIAGWQRRYARFLATEGASEAIADPADPPQAADFLLTIGALVARQDALARRREPIMMQPTSETAARMKRKRNAGLSARSGGPLLRDAIGARKGGWADWRQHNPPIEIEVADG